MENDCPAAALNDVQPDGSQIVSTVQDEINVSTLN